MSSGDEEVVTGEAFKRDVEGTLQTRRHAFLQTITALFTSAQPALPIHAGRESHTCGSSPDTVDRNRKLGPRVESVL